MTFKFQCHKHDIEISTLETWLHFSELSTTCFQRAGNIPPMRRRQKNLKNRGRCRRFFSPTTGMIRVEPLLWPKLCVCKPCLRHWESYKSLPKETSRAPPNTCTTRTLTFKKTLPAYLSIPLIFKKETLSLNFWDNSNHLGVWNVSPRVWSRRQQ